MLGRHSRPKAQRKLAREPRRFLCGERAGPWITRADPRSSHFMPPLLPSPSPVISHREELVSCFLYCWPTLGLHKGNVEKREVSTRPFSAANHPVASHHTWEQIQSPSARFQAPVAWPHPPQVISCYAAHRPPRPPTQTLCCSWHVPRSFLLSGLCPGSSPARSTLPQASPGWLHLVIQVCCKPLRVPPNSLFLPTFLLTQLGFCSRAIAVPPPPLGVHLDLSHPIMVKQDRDRGLFCGHGLLAKDSS